MQIVKTDKCVPTIVSTVLDACKRLEFPPEVTEGLAKVVLKGIKAAEQVCADSIPCVCS